MDKRDFPGVYTYFSRHDEGSEESPLHIEVCSLRKPAEIKWTAYWITGDNSFRVHPSASQRCSVPLLYTEDSHLFVIWSVNLLLADRQVQTRAESERCCTCFLAMQAFHQEAESKAAHIMETLKQGNLYCVCGQASVIVVKVSPKPNQFYF